MKFNKIILPVVAGALILGSCDDNKMEWGTPDDHGKVEISDIPLALKEKLANYKMIKEYAREYTPGMTIGLGLGADLYISDEQYRQVADENFQLFTCGNAMKHSSVVQNNGSLNFTTIDNFLNAVPADIEVYGHNFIWHTQQKQVYLKSLIAPEVKIETSSDDVCENIVTNSGFEDGNLNGWQGFWCDYTYAIESPGHDSDNALHITTGNPAKMWDAQLFWTVDGLDAGTTYAYAFWVKSDCNLELQFIGSQSESPYSGIYKDYFIASSDWTYCTGEFIYTEEDPVNIGRVGIQFGGVSGANLWIDDFKFGKKIEGPHNYCTNGSFESGTEGWTLQNQSGGIESVALDDAIDGKNALKMVASADVANAWDLQAISPEMPTLPGKKVQLSFYVKSDQAGKGRVSFSSALSDQWPWMNWTGSQSSWTEAFETSTSWQLINVVLQNFGTDFVDGEQVWQFNLDFGYIPGVTYYIDNIKVVEYEEPTAQSAKAVTRAGGMTYIYKTPEEKKALLLGAMEEWIKGMAEHVGDRVKAWDVINEPISDNIEWRGIEGKGFMDGDTAPVEDNGLSLNWGDDHFYWGYYIGKEYATKAFEYARKYTAPGAKLFVNDYNLETSPNKLAALIDFVKYIDENNGTGAPIVDGIGTQMHVSSSITQAQVDAMFQTMAATGKLVRVTELDVQLGTASPSADQLETQANVYRMIIESYKANVPEAQQSGITIWTLTDSASEHEYWLPNDAPNLFDANYGRKHAYKGVCDGIAGRDISEDFTGDMWDTGLAE